MLQNISSDFSLQERGENFALIRTDASAEIERLSVSDVNRLVPEKVFAIPSFVAKHHFTLGIKDSKTEVTDAVIYIIRANHTVLQLLAHIILMCLLHFRPWVYTARYANTLPSLSSLPCINYLRDCRSQWREGQKTAGKFCFYK